MRHAVSGRKFDMPTGHRKALFRGLVRSLFLHEKIKTTVPRAKEVRPLAERMITLAKHGIVNQDGSPEARLRAVNARRRVLRFITDKDVVEKLFAEIAPRYVSRPGGYTRIVRVGRRLGDGAEMAVLELV
ncbi:MAG: 50S ribosomal protein L17 [Chloroflexota bacterium]|jgi:large subunit ribosomal protein L17